MGRSRLLSYANPRHRFSCVVGGVSRRAADTLDRGGRSFSFVGARTASLEHVAVALFWEETCTT